MKFNLNRDADFFREILNAGLFFYKRAALAALLFICYGLQLFGKFSA